MEKGPPVNPRTDAESQGEPCNDAPSAAENYFLAYRKSRAISSVGIVIGPIFIGDKIVLTTAQTAATPPVPCR